MVKQWQALGKLGRFAVVMALALFVLVIVLSVQLLMLEAYIRNELPATTTPVERRIYPARLTMSE